MSNFVKVNNGNTIINMRLIELVTDETDFAPFGIHLIYESGRRQTLTYGKSEYELFKKDYNTILSALGLPEYISKRELRLMKEII